MDKAIDKACRGSGVPLKAFWCEAGLRFLGDPAKCGTESIGLPKKTPAFCGT